MPVSLNGGFPMTAWFDIYGLDPGAKEDLPGIKSAADEIRQMISSELRKHNHLTHENVILGGFSLGGALALYTYMYNEHLFMAMYVYMFMFLCSWIFSSRTFKNII